jgi:hypothetical protein
MGAHSDEEEQTGRDEGGGHRGRPTKKLKIRPGGPLHTRHSPENERFGVAR